MVKWRDMIGQQVVVRTRSGTVYDGEVLRWDDDYTLVMRVGDKEVRIRTATLEAVEIDLDQVTLRRRRPRSVAESIIKLPNEWSKLTALLEALRVLCEEHDAIIGGCSCCGCCGSPFVYVAGEAHYELDANGHRAGVKSPQAVSVHKEGHER